MQTIEDIKSRFPSQYNIIGQFLVSETCSELGKIKKAYGCVIDAWAAALQANASFLEDHQEAKERAWEVESDNELQKQGYAFLQGEVESLKLVIKGKTERIEELVDIIQECEPARVRLELDMDDVKKELTNTKFELLETKKLNAELSRKIEIANTIVLVAKISETKRELDATNSKLKSLEEEHKKSQSLVDDYLRTIETIKRELENTKNENVELMRKERLHKVSYATMKDLYNRTFASQQLAKKEMIQLRNEIATIKRQNLS